MDTFILYTKNKQLEEEINHLLGGAFRYRLITSAAALQKKSRSDGPNVVLLDWQVCSSERKASVFFSAFNLLPQPTLILLADALPQIKQGLSVFLMKPNDLPDLKILLKYLLQTPTLPPQEENGFIIYDKKMRSLIEELKVIRNSDMHILLTGETGSGKTELARYIHAHSRHRHAPFMHINCAAIPENLLEAELFGYKKGAFTGALRDTHGKFWAAGNGTILLDEIGEISPFLQAKMLKVLDEKEYYPLGSTKPEKVKARIIAATNTNIIAAVKTKKFRQDLYYRLNTIEIHIPPLRERKEEIPLFFKYFLQSYYHKQNQKTPPVNPLVYEALKNYHWPGNIRELQNLVERTVHKNPASIEITLLPDYLLGNASAVLIESANRSMSLQQVKKKYAKYIFELNDSNKNKTAKILKVDIKTARKLLS